MAMTLTPRYLLDTTVFIDYLRGSRLYGPAAQTYILRAISGSIEAGISPITDFELWYAIKTKAEEKTHKTLLAKFRRYQFNTTIARRAGVLWPLYKNSGPSIPDIILVATAESYQCTILTRNPKHFDPFNALIMVQGY